MTKQQKNKNECIQEINKYDLAYRKYEPSKLIKDENLYFKNTHGAYFNLFKKHKFLRRTHRWNVRDHSTTWRTENFNENLSNQFLENIDNPQSACCCYLEYESGCCINPKIPIFNLTAFYLWIEAIAFIAILTLTYTPEAISHVCGAPWISILLQENLDVLTAFSLYFAGNRLNTSVCYSFMRIWNWIIIIIALIIRIWTFSVYIHIHTHDELINCTTDLLDDAMYTSVSVSGLAITLMIGISVVKCAFCCHKYAVEEAKEKLEKEGEETEQKLQTTELELQELKRKYDAKIEELRASEEKHSEIHVAIPLPNPHASEYEYVHEHLKYDSDDESLSV